MKARYIQLIELICLRFEEINIELQCNQKDCKNVIKYDTNEFYYSDDEQNSWICFDFKDKRIIQNKLPN